jgi:predicted nucleotidyltransferase
MDLVTPDAVADIAELSSMLGCKLVLIGAAALATAHQLWWRASDDLDLLLAIDSDPRAQPLPAGWRRERAPQRIVSARGIAFDLVPAGPKLRAAGTFDWGDGVLMNLVGADLAFHHATEVVLHDTPIAVAPPPVVVMLKMVAFLDRPAQRIRDLTDIGHLLAYYIGDDDDRRFDEGLGLDLELEQVSAYLLGTDVGAIVGDEPALGAVLERFLRQVEGPLLLELARQLSRSDRADVMMSGLLAALRRGLVVGRDRVRARR